MFDIGSYPARSCAGLSRRAFLRLAASAPLGLGLAGITEAAAAARAKSVIFVFLWGAPSHLDTFDPKPDAPSDYRGPFGVIATRTPGVHFTELLPRIAQRSHRFTLVRTHVTTNGAHPPAGTLALTGFDEMPEHVQPNFGAIVARSRGQADRLPPFVSLASGVLMDGSSPIRGYGGGKLGTRYDPLRVGCSERGAVSIPALRLLDDLNPARLHDRGALRAEVDRAARMLDYGGLPTWERSYQEAYGLLLDPETRRAFDLTRETPATRGRYGQSAFGQSALLARRLVEAGVPYIQLNYSRHVEAINPGYEFGWDTHIYNFELLQDQHCPILDRAYSALLDDLYDRGLIDRTLVVCMGEFGRTPRINQRAARDHWTNCYFSLWAGAGIATGRVLGSSDRRGEEPRGDRVTPLMVGTTIAELAGIDAQKRVELGVLPGGRVIDGLCQSLTTRKQDMTLDLFRPPAHRQRDQEPVRLTMDGRRKFSPVFLNNGNEIVYVDLEKPELLRLQRLNLATGAIESFNPAANTSEFEPAVSADGRYCAFLRTRGPLSVGVIIRNTTSRAETEILPGEGFSGLRSPALAPDGSRLAYAYADGGRQQLYSVDAQGSDRKALTDGPGLNMAPSYSPDGQRIAFCSTRHGNYEIYVMEASGGNSHRLTHNPYQDLRPCFSPDGRRIAFTSHRDGKAAIYVMNADGTAQQPFRLHGERDDYPAWHPDGRRLVVVSERNGQTDLYMIRVG
jgi:Tol biopolymer transport system component/uncharacterized protein (DUF1501 family)